MVASNFLFSDKVIWAEEEVKLHKGVYHRLSHKWNKITDGAIICFVHDL